MASFESLKDKVVLLTGASSGIGHVTALAYAEQGAHLVLAARREELGEGVAEEARAKGVRATFVKTDVADRDQCRALVQRCVDEHGRLDIACNNAGIEGDIVPFIDYPDDRFEQVMDINVRGTWYCLQAELRQMVTQSSGAIVNVGSVAGLIGFPGAAAYSASKHAMVGMTKVAAQEYGEMGIRTNVVCPALIETEMADRFTGGKGSEVEDYIMSLTFMRRRGTPEEVANLILWLSSDESSYVTGAAYAVDGGALTI